MNKPHKPSNTHQKTLSSVTSSIPGYKWPNTCPNLKQGNIKYVIVNARLKNSPGKSENQIFKEANAFSQLAVCKFLLWKYIPWISQIQTSLLLINQISFKIFKNFPGVPQKLLTHHHLTYFIYSPSSSHIISTCLLAPPHVPRCLAWEQQGAQVPLRLHRPGGKPSPRDHVQGRCAARQADTWEAGAHRTPPGCGLAWAWAPAQGPADLFSWPRSTLLFCSCLSNVPQSCSPVSRMSAPLGWGRIITVNASCIYFSVDVNSLQDSI